MDNIKVDDLKIRIQTTYEFSTRITIPLPEKTIKALKAQDKDNGLYYSPMIDDNITENLNSVLDNKELMDRFAAQAKKKGFERVSTGVSVKTINVSTTDKTHTVEISLTKSKG